MKQLLKESCEIKLPIEVDTQLGQAHLCLFLRDSASNKKLPMTNTIQLKVNMHVQVLESNALLLQHVVETMINAIITGKKWFN